MNAIRQFVEVKNHTFTIVLPDDFDASSVEVIILPKQQNKIELSDETKIVLDSRLNDYMQNPDEVKDFDLLLDELEQKL
ncbi:hypothetical protein [Flavobacterium gawalongense]|uniref:Uncharacterized protein n=1 Tax=Flavobacterium gawalongense TaxID=2594432 RepID=A0A553BZ04_9FLAO|nr:hypothetical protein [Flavobacterium gawalongense]TRX04534.1 hypothetical protein FNW33_00510 [Flavobacterium gawalongense]TRX10421.1 hypothetical protein FNW12_00495 [Flavobacterium gawalongense]TRX13469.1 hypothetical protein FNW11_01010 [Flavobacterium gawalongense]TRX15599.1 hypothetical protein FNW10_00680 [Flavobacterium gawalongense]TRX31437.1 hypothetical protein FNW38_00680 [Flavobacterium gawalongense]